MNILSQRCFEYFQQTSASESGASANVSHRNWAVSYRIDLTLLFLLASSTACFALTNPSLQIVYKGISRRAALPGLGSTQRHSQWLRSWSCGSHFRIQKNHLVFQILSNWWWSCHGFPRLCQCTNDQRWLNLPIISWALNLSTSKASCLWDLRFSRKLIFSTQGCFSFDKSLTKKLWKPV